MKKKTLLFLTLVMLNASWAMAQTQIFAGFTATSGEGGTGNEGYPKLVDNKFTSSDWTKWCYTLPGNIIPYVEFHSDVPFTPTSYILTTGNDNQQYPGRNPRYWAIKAKLNEDDAWTTLTDEYLNNTMQDYNFRDYEFNFTNPTGLPYKYFRFEVYGVQNGNVLQLCELRFKGTPYTSPNLADATITGINPTYTYTGSAIALNYTVTNSVGTTLTEGTDYTTSLTCNGSTVSQVQNVGNYTITFTGMGNYNGSQTKTFEVISQMCEGFESGALPQGWWTSGNATCQVGKGDYYQNFLNNIPGTHSGDFNFKIYHIGSTNTPTYLILPAQDFSHVTSATLNFWYINRKYTYCDEVEVCYRIGNGPWNTLWSTATNHQEWTEQSVTLTGFAANYVIAFKYTWHDSMGIGLDDICLTIDVPEDFTTTVTGHGGNSGNWHLIASPLNNDIDPAAVTNMIAGTATDYDLYRFDQSQALEWVNYKSELGGVNSNFGDIVPGQGYLYANRNTTNLTFNGIPYHGNGQITLSKVSGADFSGWNLIGNPFATAAILKDANNANQAFYTLNSAGSELVAGTIGDPIAAMEGVFVVAETDNQVVTFTQASQQGVGEGLAQVCIDVSQNRGNIIDRAIVRFDDGGLLPKLQLNTNNTKIYITEGNRDYAVVRSANEGEMPLNFEAAENGTYTLSFAVMDTEMAYLHLVDNMTGADVDLLQTPSYTFEAHTNDYASRFRLVFRASQLAEPVEGPSDFAFFDGNGWQVSNIGEATLQVIDITGRVLSSQAIKGNATIDAIQTSGIYMLRLVSGDNVKVQKIVIK